MTKKPRLGGRPRKGETTEEARERRRKEYEAALVNLPPYKRHQDLPPLTELWQGKYKIPHYFSDEDILILERNDQYLQQTDGGKRCPVCLNKGSFSYRGKVIECPDDTYGHATLRLSKLYYLHNIPLQYQQLNWSDWPTAPKEYINAKVDGDMYIERFPRYRVNGVGLTVFSKGLGTGKTWFATSVLKELVKLGHDGWFAEFYKIKNYYEMEDRKQRDFLISRLQSAQVLVLDDVIKPWTDPMRQFFANQLEELIRPRSDANLPTIITTNLTPDELESNYPRVFSLMSAKNTEIELPNKDHRLSNELWRRNTEIAANDEALPIE